MLSSDSIIEDCIMLFDYCTKSCGYNLFIIDEIDGNKLRLLRKYIEENNVVMCKKYYKIISDEVDEIRNRYCYNVLPYKTIFRYRLTSQKEIRKALDWLYNIPLFK